MKLVNTVSKETQMKRSLEDLWPYENFHLSADKVSNKKRQEIRVLTCYYNSHSLGTKSASECGERIKITNVTKVWQKTVVKNGKMLSIDRTYRHGLISASGLSLAVAAFSLRL